MPRIEVQPKLKIASHTYQVLFDEREDDGDFRGSALHRHHEVALNPKLHAQQLRVTYLHEVLHVIDQSYCMHLSEDAVGPLAEGLAEFLFNNLGIELDFSKIDTRKVR